MRINAKLSPGRFVVTKREIVPAAGVRVYATRRGSVSYRLAHGDPATSRYEVTGDALDLAETAARLGLRLDPDEAAAVA